MNEKPRRAGRRKVRAAELEEMRRDIAALWLAFGQHERMIREVRAQLEALGAPPIAELTFEPDPPPGPAPTETPAPAPPSINDQLSELDQVLAAIEQATQTLERTYADEIAGGEGGPAT